MGLYGSKCLFLLFLDLWRRILFRLSTGFSFLVQFDIRSFFSQSLGLFKDFVWNDRNMVIVQFIDVMGPAVGNPLWLRISILEGFV